MGDEGVSGARADAFALVFMLAQELTRRADRELAHLGLSTRQWLLLAVLNRGFGGRPTRLGEAAAAYGTSRQNVKQIALQLESRGYLEITPDPDDARAVLLNVTPKVAVFDAPAERRRQGRFLHDILSGLSESDVQRLEELLRAWRGALVSESEPPN
jgi:DNA-binding MarR family transcriptional regulator